MKRSCLVVIAGMLWVLKVCPTVLAVESSTVPVVGATSSTFTVAAIAMEDVSTQAASLSDRLREIMSDLSSDAVENTVKNEFPVLSREVNARLSEDAKLLRSDRSLDSLRGVEFSLKEFNDTIDGWAHDLTRRVTQLGKQSANLQLNEQMWEATLSVAQSPDVPADVRRTIQSSISDIRETQTALDKRSRDILSLENQVEEENRRVDEMTDEVRQTRARVLDRLLKRDSPALWNAQRDAPAGAPTLMEQGRSSLLNQLKSLAAYAEREQGRLLVHLLLVGLLVMALEWIRRQTRRWVQDEPALHTTVSIFESPGLIALVLSILISGWLYPQAPRLLWAILGALALVPTTMILRRLIEPPLYPILNALMVFYFIDQWRSVMAALPVLSRWLIFVEVLSAIFFLIWLLRKIAREAASKSHTGPWKVMVSAARISCGILVLGLFANLFGYLNLAILIIDAVFSSAYLAVILYASVEIIDGVVMIALRLPPLALLRVVREHRSLLWSRMSLAFEWLAIVLWTLHALERLALRAPLFAGISTLFGAGFTIGSLTFSLGHIVAFIVTVWAAFLISRFARFVLESDVYPRLVLAPGLPYAISTLLHYVILVAGFLMAVAALGFDMTKFTILASAFGVGLGFGMQNITNNFVSGLILLFERPIKVGDMIQIDDAEGWVEKIGIRATQIRTTNGSQVIVPNGNMLSNRLVNWTAANQQRSLDVEISVAAGSDPVRVIAVLERAAAAHPLVSKTPPPTALFTKLAAAGLTFELRAWTDHLEQRLTIRSEIVVAVKTALANEQIPIQ